MGNRTSLIPENRTVSINPSNDPSKSPFPSNRIISNKYTLWNFLPKNLFEQFRRIANFYFLISSIVTLIIDSPISPFTSLLPLLFVIFVTACKQGYEDYLHYRLDHHVNHASITVIRNKCLQQIHCQQVVIGDLVKVNRNNDVPCDIILLHSSDNGNCCYVTTSNLDGETNLKTLYVPRVVADIPMNHIVAMNAIITCQHPLADLYTFRGKIEVNTNDEITSGYLTIDNLLLRGVKLKDTDYIIGCAVYTGQETKLSLNSKITTYKFSTAEKSINKYLLLFIIILLFSVTISTIMKELIDSNNPWDIYIGKINEINLFTILNDWLTFMILYNYIVPISLYVTVELQKFLSSFFFNWDIEMYDETSDQPATANTSDLNEELGQVEYLLTDKTGTLTENLMIFRRCFIDGKVYMENDCDGYLYLLPPNGIQQNSVKLSTWEPEIWHFLLSISLCHVVHIAPPSVKANAVIKRSEYRESFKQKRITRVHSSLLMHPDLPEYEAASADEKALVEASARCGVIFQSDVNDIMEIQIKDKLLRYKRIEILEFTSNRKRMSVIVQDSVDELWLYCKGADSAIFPLVEQGKVTEAMTYVSDFSMKGLRTLVIGYKKLKTSDYENFMRNVENARQIIGDERNDCIEQAYKNVEIGLTLLGITAVEDRLQEGVSETIESLRVAGIKIWILTGDKAETAENIALSCGHFKRSTKVLKLMNQDSLQDCYMILTSFERKIKLEPNAQYGFMIDGSSMALAYKKCPSLLRSVTTACESVVCSRLSPLQKSEIVQLIKNSNREPLTAAIGDGGNDVSMINEAHVGIGIIGKEGRQAAMSADFAITKFMHLKKALLVHGHWYYERISILILYFFYKNTVFVIPQICYSVFNGFSTQALYDSVFMMCFNVFFTSFPILLYGLLEQKYPAKKLLKYPQLYQFHKRNYLLSVHQFIVWIGTGFWHACVIYFVSYIYWSINPVILFDNTSANMWSYGIFIFHMVTLITNLQILIYSSFWSVPFVSSIIFSEILFFICALSYTSINIKYDGDVYWVYIKLLMSPTFWLLTLIILAMSFIPTHLFNLYNSYKSQKLYKKNSELREERLNNNNLNIINLTTTMERRDSFQLLPWRGHFSVNKSH